MRRTLGLLAVGLLTLAGCGLPPAPAPDPPSPPATVPSPSHSPTPTPSPSPAPPEPARLAAITAARLNLEEKAGQLVMLGLWDATGSTDSTLAAIRSGGILFLGQDWELDAARATADRVKAMAHTAGVAPFVAVDQEGGQIQRLRGPGFEDIPSATVQGTWSPAQLTAAAARWGEQLRAAGVNLNFAPSADTVPPGEAAANAPIGQLERNFATDPAVVGASAAAFIAGLSQAGVMTAVKHFPGLGRVAGNTDFTADGIVDDRTTADDLYLGAFATALAARPAMVMVSLARYSQLDPDHPAALSPAIVTDLLRGRLGWDSVVVSDSLSAQAVASLSAGQRAVDFIRAGGDLTIFQVAAEAQEAWQALVDTAAADPAFAAQLEASVQRLLTAKAAAGLLSA